MAKGDTPGAGALVEVEHAGETVLALVRDIDHKGLLRLVTRRGDALTLSPAKLTAHLGLSVPVPASEAATAATVADLGGRIDTARAGIDLETIWALVASDEGAPMTATQLARLWFDADGPVEQLAMVGALREDAVYFKRRGEEYSARGEREVEAAQQQADSEQRRADALSAFAESVVACLEANDTERAQALRDDHSVRPWLDLIADFAACGDTFDRRDEAVRLLEALAAESSASRVRATPLGAFQLLHRLGLVSEHENLALRRYRIRTQFDKSLEAEAEALASALDPNGLAGLVARPESAAITIDDAKTRDLDDALEVREEAGGGCEVAIHIADVAALVRPGTPLDVEAQKRGSSVYLPDGVIPMFPAALSERALSLVAGEPRPVLSFRLRFDAAGELVGERLELAIITVAERLTYEQADAALETGEGRWAAALRSLEGVAATRLRRRLQAGAFDIDLPDVEVKLEDGEPKVHTLPRTTARALVGELMVLAGETAARYCLAQGIPCVFRTQDQVVDEADRARAEAVADPLARQLELARLLRRGELRSEPARHRGLALDAYVQATSPIRRYADLVVHYQLREHLLGRPPVFDAAEMVALAARAEAAASDCVAAQRDSDRYWLLEYLRRQDGQELDAVVLGFDPGANRPTVPVLLPEVMLRATVSARGRSVGERVRVRVVRADARRDLLQVALT